MATSACWFSFITFFWLVKWLGTWYKLSQWGCCVQCTGVICHFYSIRWFSPIPVLVNDRASAAELQPFAWTSCTRLKPSISRHFLKLSHLAGRVEKFLAVIVRIHLCCDDRLSFLNLIICAYCYMERWRFAKGWFFYLSLFIHNWTLFSFFFAYHADHGTNNILQHPPNCGLFTHKLLWIIEFNDSVVVKYSWKLSPAGQLSGFLAAYPCWQLSMRWAWPCGGQYCGSICPFLKWRFKQKTIIILN